MTAIQGSAARVIEIATAEIGTVEGPKNNETKYGAFTKENFLPWCGSFCQWVFNQAAVKIPNVVGTIAGAAAFKKAKTWSDVKGATPQPGDLAFFSFPGEATAGEICHIGIVVKDNGDGTVTTIEGNTSKDSWLVKGKSQSNGGEVCLKLRAYKTPNRSKIMPNLPIFIVGFGRPKFTK